MIYNEKQTCKTRYLPFGSLHSKQRDVARGQGRIKVVWGPGWNLERGTSKTVVNREKINEQTEVFVLLKQKSLSKKTNGQLIWTSQYVRNSLIASLYFLLESWNHTDKCS